MLTESNEGVTTPTMVQGVNDTYELTTLRKDDIPQNEDQTGNRLVLIGRKWIPIILLLIIETNRAAKALVNT